MLFFFVSGAHANTIARYRDPWSTRWRKELVIVPYENLHRLTRLRKRGLFVFTTSCGSRTEDAEGRKKLARYMPGNAASTWSA